MATPTNEQLYDFILDSFDEEELNDLCIHIDGVRHEFGSGMSIKVKVKELIDYCNWHGIRDKLLDALEKERKEKYQAAFAQTISAPHQFETLMPQTAEPIPSPTAKTPTHPSTSDNDSLVHEKTGLEFVRIPAGTFLYGYDKKSVDLPEYWISKTPVTNIAYKKFIDANPAHEVPKMLWLGGQNNWDKSTRTFKPELAEHPVVIVNWYEAITFCAWAGLQLPTEEQWEKAARGTDGLSYPWGHDAPTPKLCNYGENVGSTTPVGQYSPQGDSPYSCVDMSGNVWEWCLNKYDKPEDTDIDQSGDVRVLRGGAWLGDQDGVHTAHRLGGYAPDFRFHDIGFRLVLARPSSQ
jgi:formylglycine-generating enzyme required for sulfatase activity